MSGSSYIYASGRVSGLEGSLLSRRLWHQLLAAEDRADVLRILGETWYGPLLQGEDGLEKAFGTAVSKAEDELLELSPGQSFTKGILQRRDVRNARYIWKNLASGHDGAVETEPPGTIPTEKLVRAWGDPVEADGLPPLFSRCLEELQELNKPQASQLDAVLDRLAAGVEAKHMGQMDEPLRSLPAVKIELRNFLTAARNRNDQQSVSDLEEILLEGGYHSPGDIAEASRMKKLSSLLGERNGLEAPAAALDEGMESGSFLAYQRETDLVTMDILDRASTEMFGPGPLVAYVLRRELEVSHLKLITAGKTAGIDPRRLKARVPRG